MNASRQSSTVYNEARAFKLLSVLQSASYSWTEALRCCIIIIPCFEETTRILCETCVYHFSAARAKTVVTMRFQWKIISVLNESLPHVSPLSPLKDAVSMVSTFPMLLGDFRSYWLLLVAPIC